MVSTHGLPAIRNPSTIYTSRHLDASDRQFMRVYIPVMLLPTDEEYNALMRGRPAAQQFAQDFAVELTWYLERRGYDQERVWMRTKWQIGDFIRPSNPGGRVGFFIEVGSLMLLRICCPVTPRVTPWQATLVRRPIFIYIWFSENTMG